MKLAKQGKGMVYLKFLILLFLVFSLIIGVSAQNSDQQNDKQIDQQDNNAYKAGSCRLASNENYSQLQEKTGLSNGLSTEKAFIALKVREAAQLIEQKGEKAFPEFRKNDSTWYRGDFYIFVWKTDGERLVYPPDPNLEGQDVSNLTDINGKPIGKLFIDTALSKTGEGWVSYEWPKPGEIQPSTKYSFIKRAVCGNETYLVGSGFYVNDYMYTEDVNTCKYINSTGISLCELMHPDRTELDLEINYSVAYIVMKPREKNLPHRLSYPEAYFVNKGNGTLYVNDMPIPLSEGKIVLIPAKETQYVENTGNSPLCLLLIDQPAWNARNEEIVAGEGWKDKKEKISWM
jgi:mannose-6-phosphate isomerase-like protein (cupin superfamily)